MQNNQNFSGFDELDDDTFDMPLSKMKLDGLSCFLCGELLGERHTQEHVFPKWLQKRYNLQNQKLDLLNRTSIPYRQILIPCCQKCNNNYLKNTEDEILKCLNGGYVQFIQLNKLKIYQWAAKIFYGLVYKQLSLLYDQSQPQEGFITSPGFVDSFENMHGLLQSFRQNFTFLNKLPFSVLIANLHVVKNEEYFYQDTISPLTASFRLGEVGIIVAFQDLGLTEDTFGNYLRQVNGQKLHPIQFDELYAKVIYQCTRQKQSPVFMYHVNKDLPKNVNFVILNGGYFLGKHKQKDLSILLKIQWKKWKIPVKFKSPDFLSSLMSDSNNNLLLLDANLNQI
jgi:hypothetical protein